MIAHVDTAGELLAGGRDGALRRQPRVSLLSGRLQIREDSQGQWCSATSMSVMSCHMDSYEAIGNLVTTHQESAFISGRTGHVW